MDEVEDRGWLVTVADRLGKYESGCESIGEESCEKISGVVMDDE